MNNSLSKSGLSESYRYAHPGGRAMKMCLTPVRTPVRYERVRYLANLEMCVTNDAENKNLQIITSHTARIYRWRKSMPSVIEDNHICFNVIDGIKGCTLQLNKAGKIISQEGYYPFGGTAVWMARTQSVARYKTSRYSGKERDASGLYYYGFRYYVPWLSRWLNPDPAGCLDGPNLFRMVKNNPQTLVDADGLNAKNLIGVEDFSDAFDQLYNDPPRSPSKSPMAQFTLDMSGAGTDNKKGHGIWPYAAIAATAVIWQTAILGQRFVTFGAQAMGMSIYAATAIASPVAELMAATLGALGFVPKMNNVTLTAGTAVASGTIYTAGGMLGAQLAKLAQPGSALSAMYEVSSVPAVVITEGAMFSLGTEVSYQHDNSQGTYGQRLKGQFTRVLVGSMMRLGANVSGVYISKMLDEYAQLHNIEALREGQYGNQLISGALSSMVIGAIPNAAEAAGDLSHRVNQLLQYIRSQLHQDGYTLPNV